MADRPVQLGSVVCAIAPAARGVAKHRPPIVIPPLPTAPGQPYECLAITTSSLDGAGERTAKMPWHPQNGASTGLFAECVVVLDWHVAIAPAAITRVSGRIRPALLNHIVERRVKLFGGDV